MEEKFNKHKAESVQLTMYTRDVAFTKRLLGGRAIFDEDDNTFLFAQNLPRTHWSKEIMRTDHARVVRRVDGLYTVSFSKMDASESLLGMKLLAEVREITRTIEADKKKQEQAKKKAERELAKQLEAKVGKGGGKNAAQ